MSVIISLFILVANYLIGNTSLPLPDEMKVLQYCDIVKNYYRLSKDSVPDDVLLINVAYDKELINYSIDNTPLGNYVITDRKKLTDFLLAAKEADSYKYIFLDVYFRKGLMSDNDSTLFSLIASMDRIVIPRHEGSYLQDTVLYAKAANSDYTVTWENTNFSRFQFIHQGVKSVPLRMYEDMHAGSMSQYGWLAFTNSWLCRNGITLKLPILVKGNKKDVKGKSNYDILNLGTDILEMANYAPVGRQIMGKVVVIGDFESDIHDTYAGPQPGSLICLNAYYALMRGDHLLLGKNFCFVVFIAIVYFALSLTYLSNRSLASFITNASIKMLGTLFSASAFFWIIAFIVYIVFDIVYNVWIPIAAFSFLDICINIYQDRKRILSITKEIIKKTVLYKIIKKFSHGKKTNCNSVVATTDGDNNVS